MSAGPLSLRTRLSLSKGSLATSAAVCKKPSCSARTARCGEGLLRRLRRRALVELLELRRRDWRPLRERRRLEVAARERRLEVESAGVWEDDDERDGLRAMPGLCRGRWPRGRTILQHASLRQSYMVQITHNTQMHYKTHDKLAMRSSGEKCDSLGKQTQTVHINFLTSSTG